MAPSCTLLLVPGSAREGSTNVAVLRTVERIAPEPYDVRLLDALGWLPIFNPDDDRPDGPLHPAVVEMRQEVAGADAVLICTPEYAGALPAALKNLLEWTIGDGGLYGKPVAWINCAGPAAPTGAADAHDSLAKVLRYASASVVADACRRLPVLRSDVGEDGLLHDDRMRQELLAAVAELVAAAAVNLEPGLTP